MPAIYNRQPSAPINLICAGTNRNRELQIETDHEDLPSPLDPGIYRTTDGMEILVSKFDHAVVINIDMESLNDLELSCKSQQSEAIITFLITSGMYS